MKWLNGFRKWSMAVIFLTVAVALLLVGAIPSVDWLSNVKDVMVAFMATNIGEHLISTVKGWYEQRKV